MGEDRRCLIVDDHAVTRVGVRGLLDSDFQVEEVSNWREAIEAHDATGAFDVAVVELDCRPPSGGLAGAAMIKALRRAMPSTGIVALARRPERHAASGALEAGACSYVAKTSPTDSIRAAIHAAADSASFVDPAAIGSGSKSTVTRRQHQILQLLADGQSTSDVAQMLHLSAETVRTHTKAALGRLEARNRAHAVAIGLRTGLIE